MEYKEIMVAKVNEITPGGMKEVTVEDKKILLMNIAGTFFALEGCCTHYGGPLTEGILHEDTLICAWHHAIFHAKTGDLEAPPALDALPKYDVMIKGEDVIVKFPETITQSRTPDMVTYDPQSDARTFVILGAGAAGNMAAQTLREDGYKGRILLITSESHTPYDRPNLSKGYLQGKTAKEWMPLRPNTFYETYGIEILQQKNATNVNVAAKTITFADGAKLTYDKLLLATGSVPRRLDIPGSDLKNIFTLRSYDDADQIITACQQTPHVVIIGASFIALEVAASLKQRNLPVTVIAPEEVPFDRIFGKEVGRVFQTFHEGKGVMFKLGRTVTRFEGVAQQVKAVVLENGEKIEADVVIVGIGVKPNTGFLQGITLQADGSIQVDSSFRAAEDVYAAGDIARFPDQRSGQHIRIEHWRTAEQQGQVTAHNMAGKQATYTDVPFFWTNQGDIGLKYVGYTQAWDEIIFHGDVSTGRFIAFYIHQNQILAAAGMKRGKDMPAIHELMRINKMPKPAELRENTAMDFLALLQNS
jgi:NADPH-dependent 2,4-dienoyl-CoA reductase/sulfur reductase-like enzyme/nitrite reductase/ring-hydroxylating ferredoxin subunit